MEKDKLEGSGGIGGKVKVKANVSLILTGPDGKVKEKRVANLIVTAGLNAMIKQVLGDVAGGAQPAKFNYVGIGTGTTAPAAGNTALETEIGTRVQDADPEFPSTGQGKLESFFAAGNGTGQITESGILSALTSGTLLARATFTAIDKGALDTLLITWTITKS